MPLVSYDALIRGLARGRRGGVYFLFGEEEFLKGEAVARLIEAHLDPTTREFNLDQLRGGEVEAEALASVLETPPLMAEWRVVVVRDAQALAASSRARAVVEGILGRPTPGLVLVLVAQLPERTRAQFYERLKREATAVEFTPLSPADLPGWLMARAEAEGVELEPEAARALAAAVGSELGILVQELGKLREYVGERGRIGVADVEAVVGRVPRHNRWEWLDLVGERRFREARAALPVLLEAGETGVGLLLALGTQFLRLGIAGVGGERALERELPANQRWLAGRLARQARGWTPEAVEAALSDLLRADRLLKSASLSDRQVLEELLLRLQARSMEPSVA
jgi:DNA polymerase-3 subunit delta